MVEKWMQGNKMSLHHKSKAYFGKPVQLFKDSDKDGVPNVFDCKPYNKRKQDVLAPMSGGSPVQEMIQRQETARQQAVYLRYLKGLQKAEEERAAEARRLSNVQVIDRTVSYGYASPEPYVWDEDTGKYVSIKSLPQRTVTVSDVPQKFLSSTRKK